MSKSYVGTLEGKCCGGRGGSQLCLVDVEGIRHALSVEFLLVALSTAHLESPNKRCETKPV